MLDFIPPQFKMLALGAALLVTAVGSAFITAKIYKGEIAAIRLEHANAVSAQDKKVADAVQKGKDDVIAAERELNAKKDELEKSNADQQKKLDGTLIANGRLVAALGGLYDKNGRQSGGPPRKDGSSENPERASSDSGVAAGCQLSMPVSNDLLALMRDADGAAVYGQTCKAYLGEVTTYINGLKP